VLTGQKALWVIAIPIREPGLFPPTGRSFPDGTIQPGMANGELPSGSPGAVS